MKTRLEAAGLHAYVLFEHHVTMIWGHRNAIGGVCVRVPEEELEEALEFLAEDTVQEPEDGYVVVCPKCGSRATQPDPAPRELSLRMLVLSMYVFVILPLLWMIPLRTLRKQWCCRDCGCAFDCETQAIAHE